MRIYRVNWDEIAEPRPPWARPTGRLWALWPSPVDHDACFETAGFNDLADSDAAWDDDFAWIVGRLVGALSERGMPTLDSGEDPLRGTEVSTSATDALIAAATNDNFPPGVVTFGQPVVAAVRTSNGHPILWVWSNTELGVESLLLAVASGRSIHHATLDWAQLW